MIYGNWIVTTPLYSKGGTHILQTANSLWVIKLIDDPVTAACEIRIILEIAIVRVRHAIALPPQLTDLYGNGWYALKRYDGCISLDDFCKSRWRTIAIHVLRFLQDFHHRVGFVHMDIKKGNILVDRATDTFVVADYELADYPAQILPISLTRNQKWYYLSMGADPDSTYVSWRFDFVALGYVLASLTLGPGEWTFEEECWRLRDEEGSEEEEAEVIALRDQELACVNPMIAEYMARVATLSWSATESPPKSFYIDLEQLFADDQKSEGAAP